MQCFLDITFFFPLSFLEAGSYEMTNQHIKQNGKLEDNPCSGSPPRTTLLGTIFSPVFNFFSPANKNGK
jgi:CTD small phosphatase-like protein 2